MKVKLPKLLAGIVLVMLCVSAAGQNALEVHAKLRPAEARTKYRIGEPIRLVLELTAGRKDSSDRELQGVLGARLR
jgi:hypothetical protein